MCVCVCIIEFQICFCSFMLVGSHKLTLDVGLQGIHDSRLCAHNRLQFGVCLSGMVVLQ